jgi:hypothetical protein
MVTCSSMHLIDTTSWPSNIFLKDCYYDKYNSTSSAGPRSRSGLVYWIGIYSISGLFAGYRSRSGLVGWIRI